MKYKIVFFVILCIFNINVLIASSLVNETKVEEVNTSLNYYYNSQNKIFIYDTNKFNCSSVGCTASDFDNIGLLTKFEFDNVGGINSYLNKNESYFVIDNGVKELSSDGITKESSKSKLRAVEYLKNGTKVSGSGTLADPYIILDIYNVEFIKIGNGNVSISRSNIKVGEKISIEVKPAIGYYLKSANCTNGFLVEDVLFGKEQIDSQFITINNNNQVNDSVCTIEFEINSFDLAISTNGYGTVNKDKINIVYGTNESVRVTPDEGYYLASVVCSEGYTHNASTGAGNVGIQDVTITNNNVVKGGTCTFNFSLSTYTVTINKIGSGSVSKTSDTINYGGNVKVTVTPSTGYHLSDASCNGNYTVSGVTIGSTASQEATINNNSRYDASTCTFTFSINSNTLAVNPSDGVVTFNGADRTTSTSVTQNYNTTISVPNPKTLPTYTISYNGNSQGATYTASPSSVTRSFTRYTASSNCGTLSNGTYTFPSSKDTTCTLTAEYNNTSDSFTLPAISRTGYTCKWAEGSALGTQYIGGTSRTITGNTTYYAVCTKDSYTVNVTCNNCSSNPTSKSITYNDSGTFTITANSNYTLDGATVSGTGCSLSGNILTVSGVTSNTTCTINAKATKCTVYCLRTPERRDGTISCSTTKSNGLYAQFTCNNGRTGSIEACYYGQYQCNGGIDAAGWGEENPNLWVSPTYLCTSNADYSSGAVVRNLCYFTEELEGVRSGHLNLGGSGYSCSCD